MSVAQVTRSEASPAIRGRISKQVDSIKISQPITDRKPVKVSKAKQTQMRTDTLATVIATTAAASTVVFSMVLNVQAFTATSNSWFGFALGIALPLWVLAATFIGQHMHDSKPISWFAYGLAAFMLLVSLPHLAHGYSELGLQEYEGWALAVVTDLTQVMCKLAIVKMWIRK